MEIMKTKAKLFWKNRQLTCMALPTFVWLVLFGYIPLIGIVIAFKDYRIYGDFFENILQSKWVGFENFKFLFSTNDAVIMIRNTVGYNSIFIVLDIVFPLILAIMLNSLLEKRLSKIYQTLLFFPYFLSWVIVDYFVFAFLSQDKGLVNSMLLSMGGSKVYWYSTTWSWPFLLVLTNVWKGLGYNIVIYIAAIVGIDRTYYEAASLDGATKLQQARLITLPMLRGLIAVLFLMGVGKIFNSNLGLFYNVPRDSAALYSVTQTIDTYVFHVFKILGDIKLSSAAAAFQSVIGLVIIVLCNFIIRIIDRDSALF
jgi:putative aldouronate transport system permease protein